MATAFDRYMTRPQVDPARGESTGACSCRCRGSSKTPISRRTRPPSWSRKIIGAACRRPRTHASNGSRTTSASSVTSWGRAPCWSGFRSATRGSTGEPELARGAPGAADCGIYDEAREAALKWYRDHPKEAAERAEKQRRAAESREGRSSAGTSGSGMTRRRRSPSCSTK